MKELRILKLSRKPYAASRMRIGPFPYFVFTAEAFDEYGNRYIVDWELMNDDSLEDSETYDREVYSIRSLDLPDIREIDFEIDWDDIN